MSWTKKPQYPQAKQVNAHCIHIHLKDTHFFYFFLFFFKIIIIIILAEAVGRFLQINRNNAFHGSRQWRCYYSET
jgi:hypothetical protein